MKLTSEITPFEAGLLIIEQTFTGHIFRHYIKTPYYFIVFLN